MTDKNYLDNLDDAAEWNAEVERLEDQDKRGDTNESSRSFGEHKTSGKRKFINNVGFNEDLFKLINDLATANGGMKLDKFIEVIVGIVVTHPQSVFETKDYKLARMSYRLNQYLTHQAELRTGILQNQVAPSIELSDMLVEFADEAGWDLDKFKSAVKNDPMQEAMDEMRKNPNSKQNRCAVWMIQYMKDKGGKVTSEIANADAWAAGKFGKEMLSRVAKQLGVRRATDKEGVWCWFFGEKEETVNKILSADQSNTSNTP